MQDPTAFLLWLKCRVPLGTVMHWDSGVQYYSCINMPLYTCRSHSRQVRLSLYGATCRVNSGPTARPSSWQVRAYGYPLNLSATHGSRAHQPLSTAADVLAWATYCPSCLRQQKIQLVAVSVLTLWLPTGVV